MVENTSDTNILYNSEKFELIEGSVKRENRLDSSFTIAKFRDKTTGKIIEIASIHLTGYDIKDSNPTKAGANTGKDQLLKTVKELRDPNPGFLSKILSLFSRSKPDLTILLGDFNAPKPKNSPSNQPVHPSPKLAIDEGCILDPSEEFTAFSEKLDHIGVRTYEEGTAPRISSKQYGLKGVNQKTRLFNFASDHLPCLAEISLKL